MPSTLRLPTTLATRSEQRRVLALLRLESVGGALLIGAGLLAVVLANSPLSEWYTAVRDHHVGADLAGLSFDLSIGHWASDGLLTVFFLLIGLELKRELVAGDLRHPGRAVVPVAAAVGGVLVPAALYLVVAGREAPHGWAIPTATDVAFAVAVLAVVGSRLPSPLRLFLLTLAVVDDLIAITVIAVAYTTDVRVVPLVAAIAPACAFALVVHRNPRRLAGHRWWVVVLLLALGLLTWALVLNSGVHATIAGVVLGLTVPVRGRAAALGEGGLAEVLEHRVRPVSAGFCVPVFAFFAAGVPLGGAAGGAFGHPVFWGVLVALVVGKPAGILGATWVVTRLRHADLDERVRWRELAGMAALAGIGFTVSLLIAELSFAEGSPAAVAAKTGVLVAAVGSSALGAAVLLPQNRGRRDTGSD